MPRTNLFGTGQTFLFRNLLSSFMSDRLHSFASCIAVGLMLGLASISAQGAAVPPAEKLLPASTLAVVSVPNVLQGRTNLNQNATWLLLQDPAMKPVVDKFVAKWQSEVAAKVEQQFGVKFADYWELAQGQLTLAWFAPQGEVKEGQPVPFVFLLDAGDKAELLKKRLEELRKKWTDSGKQIKPEKIRGVEFATLTFTSAELEKSLEKIFPSKGDKSDDDAKAKPAPGDAKPEAQTKFECLVGQSESLLVIGNSIPDLEKVLALQAGSGGPLAEVPLYASYRDSLFREASLLAWANLQDGWSLVKKGLASGENDRRRAPGTPPGLAQMIDGFGVTALRSAAYAARTSDDGFRYEFRVGVPEADRKGLLKMVSFDAKDASPPPFVPADVLNFSRSRIDFLKAIETLESTLTKVIPQSASLIKLLVDNAGKDKDPNFDLRKNLFGNLGDDHIAFTKPPAEKTLEALNSPPSLHLLGARDAEQLASAIKTLTAFLPGQVTKKDREFLGRKIASVKFPDSDRAWSFTPSAGYVVVADQDGLLEDYLRNLEQKKSALRDVPGLAEDAQKVKGMGTGLFGYVNGLETARLEFETLKKDSGSIANVIGGSPIASRLGLEDDAKAFKEWFDFSLLPPFEEVSKYFHHVLYSGSFTPEGFELKFFAPVSPRLKK